MYKIEDFEFVDGVFEALKLFQENGFKLFIITNQSGIGRDYYTKDDFIKLTSWMIEEFKKEILLSLKLNIALTVRKIIVVVENLKLV